MPRFRWILLFAVMAVFVAIMGTTFIEELGRVSRLSALVEERMAQVVSMSRVVQKMKAKIKFYRTPEGMARVAREEFNMVLPGERIFKVVIVSDDVLSKDDR